MKVKRAEIRKIQESQRKLDNEEMSEEEEEEITDEEGMTLTTIILCVITVKSRFLEPSISQKPQ